MAAQIKAGTTLQSYMDAQRSKAAIKKIDMISTSTLQGGTYNVFKMCKKQKSDHQSLFSHLVKSSRNLFDGYGYAMSLYKEFLGAKVANTYAVRAIPIDGKDIVIGKAYGLSEELDDDIITPGRFNMILTLAAANFYQSMKGKAPGVFLKFCKDVKDNVTNPIAMQHGFHPSDYAEEVGDIASKMTFYYLVMTIGFDALTFIAPYKALAISAYRGMGLNPLTLGLTNGLGMNEHNFTYGEFYNGNNQDLIQRIQQGVLTKEFETRLTGEISLMKIDAAIKFPSFIRNYQKEVIFLLQNACPTKPKIQRQRMLGNFISKFTNDLVGEKEAWSEERIKEMLTQSETNKKQKDGEASSSKSRETKAKDKGVDAVISEMMGKGQTSSRQGSVAKKRAEFEKKREEKLNELKAMAKRDGKGKKGGETKQGDHSTGGTKRKSTEEATKKEEEEEDGEKDKGPPFITENDMYILTRATSEYIMATLEMDYTYEPEYISKEFANLFINERGLEVRYSKDTLAGMVPGIDQFVRLVLQKYKEMLKTSAEDIEDLTSDAAVIAMELAIRAGDLDTMEYDIKERSIEEAFDEFPEPDEDEGKSVNSIMIAFNNFLSTGETGYSPDDRVRKTIKREYKKAKEEDEKDKSRLRKEQAEKKKRREDEKAKDATAKTTVRADLSGIPKDLLDIVSGAKTESRELTDAERYNLDTTVAKDIIDDIEAKKDDNSHRMSSDPEMTTDITEPNLHDDSQ